MSRTQTAAVTDEEVTFMGQIDRASQQVPLETQSVPAASRTTAQRGKSAPRRRTTKKANSIEEVDEKALEDPLGVQYGDQTYTRAIEYAEAVIREKQETVYTFLLQERAKIGAEASLSATRKLWNTIAAHKAHEQRYIDDDQIKHFVDWLKDKQSRHHGEIAAMSARCKIANKWGKRPLALLHLCLNGGTAKHHGWLQFNKLITGSHGWDDALARINYQIYQRLRYPGSGRVRHTWPTTSDVKKAGQMREPVAISKEKLAHLRVETDKYGFLHAIGFPSFFSGDIEKLLLDRSPVDDTINSRGATQMMTLEEFEQQSLGNDVSPTPIANSCPCSQLSEPVRERLQTGLESGQLDCSLGKDLCQEGLPNICEEHLKEIGSLYKLDVECDRQLVESRLSELFNSNEDLDSFKESHPDWFTTRRLRKRRNPIDNGEDSQAQSSRSAPRSKRPRQQRKQVKMRFEPLKPDLPALDDLKLSKVTPLLERLNATTTITSADHDVTWSNVNNWWFTTTIESPLGVLSMAHAALAEYCIHQKHAPGVSVTFTIAQQLLRGDPVLFWISVCLSKRKHTRFLSYPEDLECHSGEKTTNVYVICPVDAQDGGEGIIDRLTLGKLSFNPGVLEIDDDGNCIRESGRVSSNTITSMHHHLGRTQADRRARLPYMSTVVYGDWPISGAIVGQVPWEDPAVVYNVQGLLLMDDEKRTQLMKNWREWAARKYQECFKVLCDAERRSFGDSSWVKAMKEAKDANPDTTTQNLVDTWFEQETAKLVAHADEQGGPSAPISVHGESHAADDEGSDLDEDEADKNDDGDVGSDEDEFDEDEEER